MESRLEVPFYIYETPTLKQIYNRCQGPARTILDGNWPEGLSSKVKHKSGEIFWLSQLWNDTWRTYDPEKALVFVLPIYPVLLLEEACEGITKEMSRALVSQAVNEITALPYFHRHGGLDHVALSNDFRHKMSWFIKQGLGMPFYRFVGNITFVAQLAEQHHPHWGCAVAAPFTSAMTFIQRAYEPFEKETLLERGFIEPDDVFEDDRLDSAFDPPSRRDWFARDYTMFFQGQVDPRGGYLLRRLGMQHLVGWRLRPNTSSNVFVTSSDASRKYTVLDADGKEREETLPKCPRRSGVNKEAFGVKMGKFERCNGRSPPTKRQTEPVFFQTATFLHRLSNSKLNLCFRGDDVTSNRYVDGVWTQTLNVLITDVEKVYRWSMPFQCEVPWRNFTYAINGSVFEKDPRAALRPILEELHDDPAAIREKLRLMEYHSRKVLWDAPNSTTARSVLRAMTRQCLTDEMKVDFVRRTYGHDASVARDHPLFSPCAFLDTASTSALKHPE
ncbi:unnamed protein product [Vitrella brassicaformis CCMP3155]|uniref:Exostosin GT47 domain-containing protein n=1 Tax=Vitrella brassicaformis (strain CCMP3155) TaxID=1169540 RepID=A0A0G4GJ29_VITBC|nr:unnamed protein product [Vitrella brassicaformis CCMP3155]|eukprot:CEM29826.1 unnamed protein product [Vitrella brassicaformis CCMP3155]